MTFTVIANGDPIVAPTVMENFRHVNYGAALLPVDSTGASVDSTIDLGSTTKYFKDGYIDSIYTTGEVGIGTTSPDGLLHVFSGSAGSVTPISGGDTLVVENSGAVGISLLCPNTAVSSIFFGDEDDNNVCNMSYSHSTDTFTLIVNALTSITVDSSRDVTIDGGGLSVEDQPRARATRSSTYNSAASAYDIPWDTEDYDTDAFHDNSIRSEQMAVPSAGQYFVSATVLAESPWDDLKLTIKRYNSSGAIQESISIQYRALTNGLAQEVSVSGFGVFSSGDYAIVNAAWDSANADNHILATGSNFQIIKLS